MKRISLLIPDEFEEDLKNHFEEFFERVSVDIKENLKAPLGDQKIFLAGNYELETAQMFENAFKNAIDITDNDFYLLIVGTRTFANYDLFKKQCNYLLSKQTGNIHIVSGGASGADSLAERYAIENKYIFHKFPADWGKYGKAAGYKRNEKMHDFISKHDNRGCVCFWDGESKGTAQSFELAPKYKNPLIIYNYSCNKYVKKYIPLQRKMI